MSSYAALASLLHILETLPDRGRLLIINNKSQIHSLHENVTCLLAFLDKHNTCEASMETKIRDAAYKAEDLIEFHILRANHEPEDKTLLNSFISSYRLVLIFSTVLILAFNLLPVIPFPIQLFMLVLVIPVLLVVVTGPFRTASVAINLLHERETEALRRVLYDFDTIVKEVDQDKEMSASAALIPLRKFLDSELMYSKSAHNRSQLKSLHQKVIFLLNFLENTSAYMTSHKSELEIVEMKIKESVYRAKPLTEISKDSDRRTFWRVLEFSSLYILPLLLGMNIIMLQVTDIRQLIQASFQQVMIPHWILSLMAVLFLTALSFGGQVLLTSGLVLASRVLKAANNHGGQENQDLREVIDGFSVIVRNVNEIKDAYKNPNILPATAAVSCRRTERKVVVGLDSDLEKIRDRLAGDSSELEVVSIVGMGGIGKTTLANLVYEDPYIVEKFDVRAWISTVSKERPLRDILLGLLDSAKKLTTEMREENEGGLGKHLHQHLMGRTYLIVMDDVWDTETWERVKNYFPKKSKGSCVLLTSRIDHVARHPKSNTPHQMQCLKEEQSWNLLRERVFGAETCPLELESFGKEIARRCSGLPLAIIVIGGLLFKDKRIEIWREIARDIKSKLGQSKERYLEILGLSYNHLPHHLRPCFLYMGAFVGDSDIPVSRLKSLWAAEGFLKPSSTSKTLEDIAEDSLKDLIDRNLISVCKRSCNDKIRTCKMHDLLRDVCQVKTRKEGFLHVVQWGGNVRRDETLRRVSIRSDARLVGPRHDHLLSRCYNVRSFFCTSMLFSHHHITHLQYVRVLDVLVVHFSMFPNQITGLVLLRYLAFHCDALLPPSMSKLQNLETIVYHHSSYHTPNYPLFQSVIWNIPSLRHFHVKPGCYLSSPLGFTLPWKKSALKHLQTLVGIRNFRWSKDIIKRIPNLKKLVVSYDVSSSVDWVAYHLENLVHLLQLESLEISIQYNDEGSAITRNPPKLAFPQQLRKLSLSGGGIPWASIGGLPNLEALKLRCEACSGESWETAEGEFPQLMFLLLEKMSLRRWETLADTFRRLKRVVIRSCGMLEEIPEAIGKIPTLEMIHLVDCPASVVDSAIQIRDDQEYMGNESLKVCTGVVME